MTKYKICLLTYKLLDDLAQKAINHIQDDEIELLCLQCYHNTLIKSVEKAQEMGFEIFIAGGSNYEIFRNQFSLPIIGITLSYYDYMKAILKASSYGNHVAIISYLRQPHFSFSELEQLLHITISHIVYDDSKRLPELIRSCSCQTVIGTAFACDIAANNNKIAILIYSSEDEIVNAIYKAKTMAKEIRLEKTKARFFSTIVDYSPVGIIAINGEGIISSFNHAAENIFGLSASKVRNKSVYTIFPELRMDRFFAQYPDEPNDLVIIYHSKKLHVSRQLIMNDDTSVSAIVMIIEVSRYKNAEIRSSNNSEQTLGFRAKYNFDDIIGVSKEINNAINMAKIYANSHSNILIFGETGSGKELFAQSIHNYSYRKDQPFVAVNCAAIPDSLLESELFGYIDGAFTGSRKGGKKGLFELSNHGTIFLDEIGDIRPTIQIKLMRVLQEKEILRIGDDRVIPIDVRVISATNKSQSEMLKDGFRPDLLYRLNVFSLSIPPLRKRGKDIILLFRHFFSKYTDDYQMLMDIRDDALDVLQYYSWPGNVRELENVCQRFILFFLQENKRYDNNTIRKLISKSIGENDFFQDILNKYGTNVLQNKDTNELDEMMKIIKHCFGYSNEYIAEKLGISRSTLWRIINKQTTNK